MRTCERAIKNSHSFESIEFKELKEGDLFRLFDDFNPVIDSNGFTIWKALSDAYLNDEGIWQVNIMDSLTEK